MRRGFLFEQVARLLSSFLVWVFCELFGHWASPFLESLTVCKMKS